MFSNLNCIHVALCLTLFVKAFSSAQILGDSEECVPLIASGCFTGFFDVLDSTSVYDSDKLCSSSYDRLQCSQDIIDTGCTSKDGRMNFDSWMEGLKAIHQYLCLDSGYSLSELLKHSKPRSDCFDIGKYLSCIKNKTGVTHVADMLYVALSAIECNWVLISFSTCSSTAHKPECAHIPEILNEVVHIFIQKTKCSAACVSSSTVTTSVPVISLIVLFVFCNVF